ncbi:MAG: universal stress protein [Euryarchaeota archaeon]|nr:universal stress protein [Euryarchaeota archaeon]
MALRVLAPLDGSETSQKALENGLRILQGVPEVQVTLFNVTHEGFDGAPAEMVEQFDRDEDDEIFPTRSASLRMLERTEALCKGFGVETRSQVVEGKVVDRILEACKEHDLLLMHALDKTQFKENLRGSQAEKIARRAGIAVLLVPYE